MRVKGFVKDKRGRLVLVEVPRAPEKCKTCALKMLCGYKDDMARVWVLGEAPRGAEVEVELSEAKAITLAFLAFMAPVLVYLVAFLLLRLKFSLGVSAGLAFIPMALWFPLLNLFSDFFKPKLVR